MNISIWDIFKYLFKWKFAIVAVVVLSFLASYIYVDSNQTYNSQIVLSYSDASIAEGKAPDGTDFDSFEITSPKVITETIKDLSLSRTVDSIRSRITVSPIIPDSEREIKEAKIKSGESYTYYPTTFSVTYAGQVGQSSNEVRDILDTMVSNYLEFYNSKYLQPASINNVVYDEDMGDYDYLELVDIMNDNITKTITSLRSFQSQESSFRSTSTGLSFSDISKEYQHLKDYIISKLYSDIYSMCISKNPQQLVEKYTQKKEQYILESQNFSDKADLAKSRMDNFADANKRVPNSYHQPDNNDNNSNGLDVTDNVYDGANVNDTKTTYDTLINNYVTFSIAANNDKLLAEHCENVSNIFESAPQIVLSETETENVSKSVLSLITETEKQLDSLYKTASSTIDDYNAYTATRHINILTGVKYYTTLSSSLYAMIAVMIGFSVSVLGAVTVEILLAFKVYNKKKKSAKDEPLEKEDSENEEKA